MDTSEHFLLLAAYNNSVWCDTICRSHNILGEFHETCWLSWQQTPLYYPNLVTLSPTASLTSEQGGLVEFLTMQRDYATSVKDSFAVLDLAPFGFHELFQAQWICLHTPTERAYQKGDDLQWKLITSERELMRWEEAWSQSSRSPNRLFLPALLDNPDVSIVAAYRENQIIAGAIANTTTGVVGLSNVFTPSREEERYWQDLLSLIATHYPSLPLVGYEQAEHLALALRVGFIALGPLRVWIKA